VELPLRQDLDEVLGAEHLSQDWIGEHSRIDRILRAMCGRGSDLVANEVGDVDARAHPGVDLIPRRKRSGPEKLKLLPASVARAGFRRRECQACDIIHGDHVRVARLARGDAFFSDEFPGP
jgi:hypothetical protein